VEEAGKRFAELSEHFGTVWIGRAAREVAAIFRRELAARN
jgi:hypothetical protein